MKKHVYSILAKRKNLPYPSTQNTDNNIPKHTKTQTITYITYPSLLTEVVLCQSEVSYLRFTLSCVGDLRSSA